MASVKKGAWYGIFLIVGPLLLYCCDSGGGWSGESLGGGNVQFDDGVPAGGVAGSYSNRRLGIAVSFYAASEEGKAHAVYRVEGTDLEITATVDDPETASMVIGDIRINGFGALSVEEATKLQELASGDLWQAIQLVPLDAGCQPGELDPAVMAALLFPWQMVLKYLVTDSEGPVREIAAQSRCEYFSHQGDHNGSKAGAERLLLGYEAPFPVAYGYFPFDDVGAAEDLEIRGLAPKALPPTPTPSTIGPDNSLCRGACGIDCSSINCDMRTEWYCLSENGENTGKKQLWTIHDCGIAAGCMVHDDCYDECNFIHGASSFRGAICRHGRFSRSCDAEAQSMYGLTQCLRWAAGFGPYDARREFYYPVEGSDVTDQQECPITEETDVPSPVDVPDVVAMAKADAERALAAVGLVAEVSHSSHDTVPAGLVISQNPAAGMSISAGSKVTIVVSTGQEGQPIGGTFAPHSEGYFTDLQITYSVEGAKATAVDDDIAQVQGRRRYTLSRAGGQASQLRVSGFGSGSNMGGSSQYAGRIVVEVWAGGERKTETYPIEINSNPPYAFDLSVPIPAIEGASGGFSIEAGMSWPNGHFSIRVSGQ